MITRKQAVNRFFLLATGPFLGMLIMMLMTSPNLHWRMDSQTFGSTTELTSMTTQINNDLEQALATAEVTVQSIEQSTDLYHKTTSTMSTILANATTQAQRPEIIYNRKITSKLGTPIDSVQSDRIRIELYRIQPGTYKGYAMKVKLKDQNAMTMVLGKDKLGASETTLQAVRRVGAVAGINAGGFADSKGKRYPLSTTIVNGEYIGGFEPTYKDLFFAGMSKNGKLIGGKFSKQADLDKLQPVYGASFVPILMQNGVRTNIPLKWQVSPERAPRTVIGNYKDDQLIMIVVDGYDEKGGSGATLTELQNKLFNMGVQNAYNLDGGGSSSFIFKGKVINSPSDGELRPLPTHFLFFE